MLLASLARSGSMTKLFERVYPVYCKVSTLNEALVTERMIPRNPSSLTTEMLPNFRSTPSCQSRWQSK